MTEPNLPYPLQPVTGPFPDDEVEGAIAGLGSHGAATSALAQGRLVPPDLLVGCTLRLLANQPRGVAEPGTDGEPGTSGGGGAASPIAGGVWVREQVSFHHPVDRADELVITGETVRRYVRKGRLYSTSVSQTRDPQGRLLVSNITTGLVRYRADPDRADADEGVDPQPIMPTRTAPAALSVLGPAGRSIAAPEPFEVDLAMMQARDGTRSYNPIHSDPEEARQAGLPAPIAGGSHVLAFALELVLEEWGPDVLLGGSHVDARWLAQVRAGDTIHPRLEVVDSSTLALSVEGADRTCCAATLTLAGRAS